MAAMLHELLSEHRHDLIRRCMKMAHERDFPLVASSQLERGVPLFLDQLVDALRCEAAEDAAKRRHSDAVLAESSRTAAVHGKALLEHGCTIEELVHGYGDICQAITELAKQKHAAVTVDEFHTLNRLLDNAIADAVASYGRYREATGVQGAQDVQERIGSLMDEERRLLRTALKALDAVRLGAAGPDRRHRDAARGQPEEVARSHRQIAAGDTPCRGNDHTPQALRRTGTPRMSANVRDRAERAIEGR